MKIWILFLFSIISIACARFQSRGDLDGRSHLVLKQEIAMLESNTLRNILREQNLSKRNEILEQALDKIQKIRDHNPVQLKSDEKSILKIVQNLRAMSSLNQAENAR